MFTHRLYTSTILFLLCICTVSAHPDTARRSVDSPERALEVALAYTGFNEIQMLLDNEKYSGVELILCKDSTIPFLVDQVYNKPVWHIFLDSVNLHVPGCPAEEEAKWNPKKFHILIDSAAGFFIKAYTKREGEYDYYLGEEPPAHRAEQGYRSSEVIHDYCRTVPNVTMQQAIGAAAGSDPLASKELTILLVSQNKRGEGAKPLWNILGRGFPPRPFTTGETIPQNNHARSVVDAETGLLLYWTSSPHPDLPKKVSD
ncbi:MAG: hypothetical protein AB1483_10415 [Candidatus Zixiibacteriota bacterium]